MIIFKSTMKKYFKQTSTWVIIAIAFLAVWAVVGPVSLQRVNYLTVSEATYTTLTIIVYSGMAAFFALFCAMFAGFKGARTFKDEVEDGTFLITLSKPITRGRIIFEKWLALIAINLLFLVSMMIALVIAILMYEHPVSSSEIYKNHLTLKQNLWKVILLLFAIGIVIAMIMLSIALMISTKVGVGATVGITLGLGLLIPVTGIVGQFSTKSNQITSFTSNALLNHSQVETILSPFKDNPQALAAMGGGLTRKDVYGNQVKNPDGKIDNVEELSNAIAFLAQKNLENLDLLKLGLNTGAAVTYNFISYLDLQYQVGQLGKIVRDAIVPSSVSSNATFGSELSNGGGPGGTSKLTVQKKLNTTDVSGIVSKANTQIQTLLATPLFANINTFWKNRPDNPDKTDFVSLSTFVRPEALRAALQQEGVASAVQPKDPQEVQKLLDVAADSGKLDQLKASEFLSPYGVMGVYLGIAAVLAPLSYYIVRRQDFR